MVKEGLCEMVVEVRRVSDRVMKIVAVFEEGVPWLICGYATASLGQDSTGRDKKEKSCQLGITGK